MPDLDVAAESCIFYRKLTKKADLEFHTRSLDLKSHRMVLVPVNDNIDYMRLDGGKHRSFLVILIAEDHSSCCFVHHDSISSCLNHTAAVKYANTLRQVHTTLSS